MATQKSLSEIYAWAIDWQKFWSLWNQEKIKHPARSRFPLAFELRFGYDGRVIKTYAEIAEIMKISTTNVKDKIRFTLRLMRHPKYSRLYRIES